MFAIVYIFTCDYTAIIKTAEHDRKLRSWQGHHLSIDLLSYSNCPLSAVMIYFSVYEVPKMIVVSPGYIVTLLWFRLSQCASLFDLVNTIETELLCASSSNLTDLSTIIKGLNPIDFGDQRSRSLLTIMENRPVNTIKTKLLCASSSKLADMSTMVRGWILLTLEVRGQRSRSRWGSLTNVGMLGFAFVWFRYVVE